MDTLLTDRVVGMTDREKIPTTIVENDEKLARVVARRIASLIQSRNADGELAVLGLATGSTPIAVYRELIRRHREDGLDFSGVVTFNLDEYYPMDPESVHSYHRYMREYFFDHVNIPGEQIHVPRGDVPEREVEEHCRAYERAIQRAGGIDFQLLGIGRTGHIGFNEPGSRRDSTTRRIFLDTVTRRDAAPEFFGEENVPLQAITMGVATILDADEIALLATGEHKARIVRRAVEGPVSPEVAATYLQEHPNARVYADPAAAGRLTRVRTPWVLGEVDWPRPRVVDAVCWLSERVDKSILRLETRDYRDHHLGQLVARYGSAPPLNGEVFTELRSRIRGRSKLPRETRILVFSPHPDDDVISMGGLLSKLQQNENEITVAYQTSGNIAVFDYEVRKLLDLLDRMDRALDLDVQGFSEFRNRIEGSLEDKAPAEVDSPAVQTLKRIIREAEAVSALETLELDPRQARFLDLPFYQTGEVKKEPIGEDDVEIVLDLLEVVRPEMVFAAGDLSDPHGTHRKCLRAVELALDRYKGTAPEVWLYRGAWEEWPVSRADVLVPMSEEELERKIHAVFKHESQKDRTPFPGPDEREFWERVQDRNKGTAAKLDQLGLPAYFAVEAYVLCQAEELGGTPIVPTASPADGEP